MDLTHLLTSCSTSYPDGGSEDSSNDRGKMFKRKGINFSTTTSEGRILRSAQETERRTISRHFEQWKCRKKGNQGLKAKPKLQDVEESQCDQRVLRSSMRSSSLKNCLSSVPKYEEEDQTPGPLENANEVSSGTLSRREKLMKWLEQKRKVEEEKKKKAKPAFRAGGVVQHPYTAFSDKSLNNSKLSMSTSNLSALMNSSRRPQSKFTRSSSLSNFRIPQGKTKDILGKIDESSNSFDPKVLEKDSRKASFVPENFQFTLEMPPLMIEESNAAKELGDSKSWTRVMADIVKGIKDKKSNTKEEEDQGQDKVDHSPEVKLNEMKEDNEMNSRRASQGDKTKHANEMKIDKNESTEDTKMVDDICDEAEPVKVHESHIDVKGDGIIEEDKIIADQDSDTENKLKVQPFRDLLTKEMERLTKVCNDWEAKISNIPEGPSFEDIKGEVRSVVGQGRLIMAERFHQFSGLVDNCEFKRGEKETTTEDLRGFWEMIFIQVEDVDKKFTNLAVVEANEWKPVQPKPPQIRISRPRACPKSTSGEPSKPKEASQGLKALIAARRKAAKSTSDENSSLKPLPLESKVTSDPAALDKESDDAAKTFDGGFFTVKSPMCERKSPRSCSKSSSNKLRQAAYSNSAKKVNSFLLSPFISAMAKMTVRSSGSPMSSDQSNNTSPVKGPKPTILFDTNEEDEQEKPEEVTAKVEAEDDVFADKEKLDTSPKLDEKYFRANVTPSACSDLINFDSPYRP